MNLALERIFVNQSERFSVPSQCLGIAIDASRISCTHFWRTSMCFILDFKLLFFINASATVLSMFMTMGFGNEVSFISLAMYEICMNSIIAFDAA